MAKLQIVRNIEWTNKNKICQFLESNYGFPDWKKIPNLGWNLPEITVVLQLFQYYFGITDKSRKNLIFHRFFDFWPWSRNNYVMIPILQFRKSSNFHYLQTQEKNIKFLKLFCRKLANFQNLTICKAIKISRISNLMVNYYIFWVFERFEQTLFISDS